MGTSNQLRALGSSIGVSITTNILSTTITHELERTVSRSELKVILGSVGAIGELPSSIRGEVRVAFGKAFIRQMYALLGLAILGLFGTGIMAERKPRY